MTFWAKPGVKCECLRSDWNDGFDGDITPVAGKVYTVRGVKNYGGFGIGITLAEIRNPPRKAEFDFGEAHFDVTAFRPLTSQPTEAEDLKEHFLPLLKDLPTPEELAMDQAQEETELARAISAINADSGSGRAF